MKAEEYSYLLKLKQLHKLKAKGIYLELKKKQTE